MFKIVVPITKSVKTSGNKMIIEGIASDPSIDLDFEKMSETAVSSMEKSVNGGGIPIRIEHENKLYSEVGVWKEAKMVGDKLFVKGELDLDFSLARDVEAMLNKGKSIALSVGGDVLGAMFEFSKELKKNIKVYTDIVLKEISIVKNPANTNATLSIAKSYDVEKGVETEEAIAIDESSKGLQKAESSFETAIKGVQKLIDDRIEKGELDYTKSKDLDMLVPVFKSCGEGEDYEVCSTMKSLSSEDMKFIALSFRILSMIDPETILTPDGLEYEDIEGLPMISFVPLPNDPKWLPYRDATGEIRIDWIAYHLARLATGFHGWISQKDRVWAIEYLMSALQQAALDNKRKQKNVSTEVAKNFFMKPTFTNDQVYLMKSCSEFKKGKTKNRPQVDGNDLSDSEIGQLSKAFTVLSGRGILKSNLDNMEQEIKKTEGEVETPETTVEEVATPEVEKSEEAPTAEEAPATTTEEAPTTTESDTPEVEKFENKKDEAEDVAKTEEAAAESSVNKTSGDEKAQEPTAEEAPASQPEGEPVEKGLTKEDVTAIATEIVKTATESLEKSLKEGLENIQKAFATANKEQIEKSAKAKADFEKATKEEISAVVATLEKMASGLNGVQEVVGQIAKTSAGRRSFATATISKSSVEDAGEQTLESRVQKFLDANPGMDFKDARATVLKEMTAEAK